MFLLNNIWGKNTPFVKILVIRGIGFRAQLLLNDALKIDQNILNNEVFINYTKEFQYKKYLIIRAGHSVELVQPIPQNIIIKIIKKNRKIIICSQDKQSLANFTKKLHFYRPPSAYTGRGIRQKHVKVLRKIGKRDSKR